MLFIVTGLPRSGTSLMMQMLHRGGFPVLTDQQRRADTSNPRGYFEYEPVKKIAVERKWLAHAGGKAVKIVVPLIRYVPGHYACRVVFMERPLDEIMRSQETLLQKQGKVSDREETNRLRDLFGKELRESKSLIAERSRWQVLFISYPDLMENPLLQAERLNRFLGGRLSEREMVRQVDPALYRQRSDDCSLKP